MNLSERTLREMAAGGVRSAWFAGLIPPRRLAEPGEHIMQPVYRPADGAGSQERMKIRPGQPGSIGHAKNQFATVRRG